MNTCTAKVNFIWGVKTRLAQKMQNPCQTILKVCAHFSYLGMPSTLIFFYNTPKPKRSPPPIRSTKQILNDNWIHLFKSRHIQNTEILLNYVVYMFINENNQLLDLCLKINCHNLYFSFRKNSELIHLNTQFKIYY